MIAQRSALRAEPDGSRTAGGVPVKGAVVATLEVVIQAVSSRRVFRLRNVRCTALVLIGLCSIALSGCGSSGDAEPSAIAAETTSIGETTATAPPEVARLSRAEFAAKADAICDRQRRTLYQEAQPTSFAELAAAMDKGSRVLRATVKEIRALKPPKEDQRLVDQMLAAFEANAATLSTVKAAALRQDQAGVEAAVALGEAPALRAGQLAYELDLTVCSEPAE